MPGADDVCIVMNEKEQRIVIKSLLEFRNSLIDRDLWCEDVDRMLVRVVDAPPAKKKRRSRDAR